MRGPRVQVRLVWYDCYVTFNEFKIKKSYIYTIGYSVELRTTHEAFRPVKVGVAADPKSRVRQLQSGNPYRLFILGTFEGTQADEKWIHSKLEPYRMEGEWFDLPSDNPAEFVRKIFTNEPFDLSEEVWTGKWDGWDWYSPMGSLLLARVTHLPELERSEGG